jgi:hypothetical protein
LKEVESEMSIENVQENICVWNLGHTQELFFKRSEKKPDTCLTAARSERNKMMALHEKYRNDQ